MIKVRLKFESQSGHRVRDMYEVKEFSSTDDILFYIENWNIKQRIGGNKIVNFKII